MFAKSFLFAVFLFVFGGHTAFAVLPPDVIFQVGSQLLQFFGVIAVFLVTAFAGASQAWQSFYGPIQNKKLFWGIVVVFILIVSYLGASYLDNKRKADLYDAWLEGNGAILEEGYRFYGDHFVLFGFSDDGAPLLIEVSANRKQKENGEFTHYYFGDVVYGNTVEHMYDEILESERDLMDNGFFDFGFKKENRDLSARAQFLFSLHGEDINLEVQTDEITTNFITKNVPEYVKFYGEGSGLVNVEGKEIRVHTLYGGILSEDFRKYIFYDGFDELNADAYQFVLWDEEGNFYLFDQTTVNGEENPAYTSHRWGLMKDINGKKGQTFDSQITEVSEGVSWTIQSSDFDDATLSLTIGEYFEKNDSSGFVVGTITDKYGTREIQGLGRFQKFR